MKRLPLTSAFSVQPTRNLALQVEKEFFRSDLFYRINVIELHVPPLRQRAADIPLLADYALQCPGQ